MAAEGSQKQAPIRLVMAVDEGTYGSLWFEPPDKRQPLTPRIFPPLVRGGRPKVIPFRTVVRPEQFFVAPLCDGFPWPKVAVGEERFLRQAGSPTLGPNAYLFCGPVSATDRWGSDGKWHLDAIVDCGVPIHLTDSYWPLRDPSIGALENWAKEGTWLMGIVKLEAWGTGTSGLFQPVAGHVNGMQVLDLDPTSLVFGKVRRVPFGYRLTVDPDFVQHESVWVVLDVVETLPPMYRPFPARPAECPEPDVPGLVHVEGGGGARIVRIGDP